MAANYVRRQVALAVAIPALAIFAFGSVSFINAMLAPWACGIVCTSPPWRSPEFSLEILGFGGLLFTFSILVESEIFNGQRTLLASGVLCLVLGSVALEASVSSLYADYLGGIGFGLVGLFIWALIIGVFGAANLSLLAVGARHWWVAGRQTGDLRAASRLGVRSGALEGVAMLSLGGTSAIVDVLLAGCIGSGPCQPNPLVPLVFPLLVFVFGLGLILAIVWQPRAVIR